MKLSKRTVEILKNFSTINPSILIREGNELSTMAPSKKVIATAQVDETFDKTFGVYELSRLLGVLSMLSEPEVTLGDRSMVVESEGRRFEYTYSEPETIVKPPEKGIPFPDVDVTFKLPAKALAELLKASGVLSLPEVAVVGKGGRVLLQALDTRNSTSHVFSHDLGETDKEFKIVFKKDVFKFVSSDYEVDVSFKKLVRFRGDVTYLVAAEVAEGRR